MAMASESDASFTSRFSPTAAVRRSSRRWIEAPLQNDGSKATTVSINHDALDEFASEVTRAIVAAVSLEVTEWDADGWHYTGAEYSEGTGRDDARRELARMERVALYVLTLDAVNFCFWPVPSATGAEVVNGLEYEHLAVALRKVAEADDDDADRAGPDDDGGADLSYLPSAPSYALGPERLAALTPARLRGLLQPHFPPPSPAREDGGPETVYELPDVDVRCRLLNELGTGLLERHRGSALRMISEANNSADALVGILLETFPGFRDYVDTDWWTAPPGAAACDWDSAKASPSSVIHFYKRAQIATADIWAALGRRHGRPYSAVEETRNARLKICRFHDMDAVTTFPDYRVPQILRHVDVLRYASALSDAVDSQTELEKGGLDEVSIRAGTVVAVEEMVRKVKEILSGVSAAEGGGGKSESDLRRLADDVSAVTIDWYLWQRGEKLDRLKLLRPHHRVRTTFY